jgi:galactonate dehydratase
MADVYGVTVAPHNPTGPVATAASVQLCAGMKNFRILELQWGEVEWRGDLVRPAERFVNGTIAVGEGSGLGITLNEELAQEKRMPA